MSKATSNGPRALVLLRTPLQAWLAEQVLEAEGVGDYRVVYFTHADAEEDRYYYERLRQRAISAEYVHAPPRRFDVLAQMDWRWQVRHWYLDRDVDLVLLASLNSHVLNGIARKQARSQLVTFDDGLSNILPSGIYHVDSRSLRFRTYRKLLGAGSLAETRARIARHYTIYPGFANVVPQDQLRIVRSWDSCSDAPHRRIKRYFIGQPFHEAISPEQVARLEAFVRTMDIDMYVRHPREKEPLAIDAPFLHKEGRIAEEAILRDADTCDVHVIGWFSAAVINLARAVRKSTVLLLSNDRAFGEMKSIAQRSGCEVISLEPQR